MESVTIKGTRVLIIPIIIAMMLNGGNINFSMSTKSANNADNSMKLYNEITELQEIAMNQLFENGFDLFNFKSEGMLIKNKKLLKKSLEKYITVTITGEKEVLAPYVLEMIYEDKVKISIDDSKVDKEDERLVGATIELENGGSVEQGTRDGLRCGLLTGSVVLNRVYYCSWCPNTVYGVLHQSGQYAPHTVKNLDTVKIPNKVKLLAKYLMVFGAICPENVIFQSQNPNLGSKNYTKIKTTSEYEYFAYE